MSIRFSIKNTMDKAQKEGDLFVRFSGVSEPFTRVSERASSKVGLDGNRMPILKFVTGLDSKKTKFYKWYSEPEQKALGKHIEELSPLIADFYGGKDVIEESNSYFWKDNRDVNRVSLSHENIDTFYDTSNPVHALLYLSIAAGAFSDTIAPTRDWAERHQLPHYMQLETEDNAGDEEDVSRSDAHAALAELRKSGSYDALFILAWCLQYDTRSYGAYLKNTPLRDLVNYHIKYIDGKLVSKRKRNMPKTFLDYAERWNGQLTRPALYVEAYVKAGEYFNFINQREKKYVTSDGTILGNTIEDAVKALQTPKFNVDLTKLRDQVEAKWKE